MKFFKIIIENIYNYGTLTFIKIFYFELINILYSIKNKDLQIQETNNTSYNDSKIKSVYNTAYIPTPYYFLYIAKNYLKKLNINKFNLIDLGCGFSRPALYFDKHETNLSLKVEHSIGTFAPLHSTALGKILIAFNNLNISDYYHNYKNISTDINKLELEIDQIKVNNYSIDDEEYEEGIRCIAAPIYHTYQDRVSAIGISGPINRLNYNSIYKLSKSLKHIASDLSLKIKRLNE